MSTDAIERAHALHEKAHRLQQKGRYADAEAPLLDAISIWTQIAGPDDLRVLVTEMNLAVSYRRRGDVDLAIPILERVTSKLAMSFGDRERAELYRKALNNLAMAYRFADHLSKARAALEFCLSLVEIIVRPTNAEREEHARLVDNLSSLASLQGDDVQAEAWARQSLAEWISIRGEENADTGIAHGNLGSALMRQGRVDEARVHIERSEELAIRLCGVEHPAVTSMNAGNN